MSDAVSAGGEPGAVAIQLTAIPVPVPVPSASTNAEPPGAIVAPLHLPHVPSSVAISQQQQTTPLASAHIESVQLQPTTTTPALAYTVPYTPAQPAVITPINPNSSFTPSAELQPDSKDAAEYVLRWAVCVARSVIGSDLIG